MLRRAALDSLKARCVISNGERLSMKRMAAARTVAAICAGLRPASAPLSA